MPTTKNYPLRLEESLAAELQFVADIDGLTVADEIRQAIADHLDRRRNDSEFQERLLASRARDQELYDRLSANVRDY